MILYTSQTSARLQYIILFVESIISKAIIITTDKDQFRQSSDIKINYSDESVCKEEYHIKPYGLLFENTIHSIEIEVGYCRNNPCFFINENDSHGFDILAATFYLISRYEEYLPHEKDIYGRYAHTNSLAYKNGFLHLPLVNFWVKDLMERLSTTNRQLSTSTSFKFIPTYDIDIAYSYLYQPITKNVLGFFKDLIKGDFEKIMERSRVYTNTQVDPFDTYDWLDNLHQQYKLQPIYFFLLAEKRGIYDKNNSPQSNGIKHLVKQHAEKYSTGIHPSWQSGDNKRLLSKEINLLEKIAKKKVINSRQHYLRFTLPATYRNLIIEKIEADYSMGYGAINGFRASITSTFFWYDLENEAQTKLVIHPFCYMDATCIFKQQLSAMEAGQELQQYFDTVKAVDGQLIIINHNHFLTEQPKFITWRNMYAKFLNKIAHG